MRANECGQAAFSCFFRDFQNRVGRPAEHILPLAAPVAMEAMKTRESKSGMPRYVDRGKELFFRDPP